MSPKTVQKTDPTLATSVTHLGLKVSPISGTNSDPLCARGVIRSAALSDPNCATALTHPGHLRDPVWARGVGDSPLPPHYIMWGQQPSGPPSFSQISMGLGLCPSGQGRRRAATHCLPFSLSLGCTAGWSNSGASKNVVISALREHDQSGCAAAIISDDPGSPKVMAQDHPIWPHAPLRGLNVRHHNAGTRSPPCWHLQRICVGRTPNENPNENHLIRRRAELKVAADTNSERKSERKSLHLQAGGTKSCGEIECTRR